MSLGAELWDVELHGDRDAVAARQMRELVARMDPLHREEPAPCGEQPPGPCDELAELREGARDDRVEPRGRFPGLDALRLDRGIREREVGDRLAQESGLLVI